MSLGLKLAIDKRLPVARLFVLNPVVPIQRKVHLAGHGDDLSRKVTLLEEALLLVGTQRRDGSVHEGVVRQVGQRARFVGVAR